MSDTGKRQSTHGLLRCKEWEDFSALARQAETLSFLYDENQKTFQVDALKDDHCFTYSGVLPEINKLLKSWLSTQLDVPKEKVVRGSFKPL